MMLRRWLFPLLLLVCLVLLAQVSQRHALRIDLTRDRIHSLSASATGALDVLDGRLEIIAFVPDLPVQRRDVEQRLAPYLAHPSRPRFEFIDPVREPTRAREHNVRGNGELHLRSGARLEVLPAAEPASIDLALNRLALRGERWLVTLTGHGEPAIDDSPAGLGRFAGQLSRLGYRLIGLDPRQIASFPDNTAALLIAAPSTAYDAQTRAQIQAYLDDGGRVLWLLGEAPADWLQQRFGIRALPGVVVDASAARYGLDSPANAIVSDYADALLPHPPQVHSVLHRARAIDLDDLGDDWQVAASLHSSAQSWNETGALSGSIRREPERGELAGPLPVVTALQAAAEQTGQRVVIVGSAHLIGNGQIGVAGNAALADGLLHWLTSNQALTAPEAAGDLDIRWAPSLGATLAIVFMAGLPLTYLAVGVWLRRRRQRR